ncbi:MAG: mycofactocin biosynthesis glycosyltransferase MftF [Acidimicrobiales bacterium]
MTVLPDGFRLELDRSVRSFRGGRVLVGGHPGRLLTLSDAGVASLRLLLEGGPAPEAARRLAGRLIDAGMAHPRRGDRALSTATDGRVTVVVPVRDRADLLDRCLSAVGTGVPVVVVDDASDDPAAVAEVCARHGARLLVRTVNGGPGAARTDALAAVDTELVAFLDSDCTAGHGWPDDQVWLFDDPSIAAVAPRVRPDRSLRDRPRSVLSRFADAHSPLDMGPEDGEVGPGRAVRYVPTAALVARRTAIGRGFDGDLRVGEDVDLVWRLGDAGWRVRYDPSVTVHHREPDTWAAWLRRRFRYGTSAGPLAARHPGRLAPVELRPWPTAVAVAALAGRPRSALVILAASSVAMARGLHRHGIPPAWALRWSAQGAGWTAVGLGRAATELAAPALVAVGLRWRRCAVLAALAAIVPPLVDWLRRRPDLDPIRWTVASAADDIAYGAGVWVGCLRSRSFGPLVPSLRTGRTSETAGRR